MIEDMRRVYYYKLTVDDGGAPCVQSRMLSLAICKPMIRSTAQPGDLIFGFAANSLHSDNRVVYIAQVTSKVQGGDYYRERRYARRDDCVYEWRRSRMWWRRGALHHGPEHLTRDLGGHPDYAKANVLISTDYRYFGSEGSSEYKRHYPRIKEAIDRLGQGHRVWHDGLLLTDLLEFKEKIWHGTSKQVAGAPTNAPSRGACHRSRSCGVLS